MKKKLLYIIVPIILYLIYFVGVLVYGTITDYQPKSQIILEEQSPTEAINKDTLSFLIWNIGYAGLGEKTDFFLDGGATVNPKKENHETYLKGIETYIFKNKETDFILLQEVDIDAKRTFHKDLHADLVSFLPKHKGVFASNFKVGYIPIPLISFSPMGKVWAGLSSFSKYSSSESIRYQYPGSYPWPKRIFHLDRCLLLQRFKVQNDKELIVINSHNSAYDGGILKKHEMKLLKKLIIEEYKKGNYVVIGADWNQCPPNFDYKHFIPNSKTEYTQTNIDEDYLPKDWKWVYDSSIPSNRKTDEPYKKGHTFVTLIDFFLISPNIELIDVKTEDLNFAFSDHQPVKMTIKLK